MYCAGLWRHWDVNKDLSKLETNEWTECPVGPLWVGVCLTIYFQLAPLKKYFRFKDDAEFCKEDITSRFERRAIDGDKKSTLLLSPQLFALMDTCVFALTRNGPQGRDDEE
jgi:hypothetical protein